MRIKFILFVCCIFSGSILFSQQDYNVKLKINKYDDSIALIKVAYGKDFFILDTLHKQKNGYFILEKKAFPGIAIVSSYGEDLFSFIFDKSNNFEIEINPNKEFVVKGCKENDLYFEFQKENYDFAKFERKIKKDISNYPDKKDSLLSVLDKQKQEFGDFQSNFYKTYPNHLMTNIVNALEEPSVPIKYYKNKNIDPSKKVDTAMYAEMFYYLRFKTWEKFRFDDIRLLGTPYFYSKLKKYFEEYTFNTPDSIASSIKDFILIARSKGGDEFAEYALKLQIQSFYMKPFSFHEERFVKIADNVINPEIAPWLTPSEIENYKEYANSIRGFLSGNKIPNISLQNTDGQRYNLYDINKKYTVLYFWSSGCESCKINLEVLENFYKENKDKLDFEVFSVDLDYDIEKSKRYYKSHPFDWIVVKSTAGEFEKLYNIKIEQTPNLLILDKDKKIINHTAIYSHVEKVIK